MIEFERNTHIPALHAGSSGWNIDIVKKITSSGVETKVAQRRNSVPLPAARIPATSKTSGITLSARDLGTNNELMH